MAVMSLTRRKLLHSTAALAALPGTTRAQTSPTQPPPAQVPKVKFGNAEISRIVLGANPFYGVSHFNATYDRVMREWCTSSKVVEIMHQCAAHGINAFQYITSPRCQADYERFTAEGGKMHLIVQASRDPEDIVKTLRPLAVYHAGEFTDNAWRQGKMDGVRDFCKRLRQLGVLVGVGSHIPEVLAEIESQGWDVDFYVGCVYNRRRTPEEWRKLLGGDIPVQPTETYLEGDPPRMYQVLRQTAKPCFAFKVLAAGRISNVERAFRQAFESLKPIDCLFVGMFPRAKDEVKENAEIVSRLLQRVSGSA